MAWVNNNKRNARFNPNRKDDRLWEAQVTSRREHKPRKQVEKEEELVSTELEHVLSMEADTRLDWLQMCLMQLGLGKMKADALFKVLSEPAFGPGDAAARKALKAEVLANLHLFSPKQKKAIQEAVGAWGSSSGGGGEGGGGSDRDRDGGGSRKGGRDSPDRKSGRDSPDRDAGRDRSTSGSRGRKRRVDKDKESGGKRRRRDDSEARKWSKSKSKSKSRSRSRSRSKSRRRRR
mmetsp:Transcript_28737/g.72914  ORF Transcript_28737/g.72914 Transcript_28737/m.72914 type:complete len:234 (-) Transcript_28737:265-966(-)